MSSTYSTNLAIELIGTGDQAGNWGSTTNTNLGTLIEQAISGYVTQAVATGTDTVITIPNGSTGVARNMFIELTGTGGASTNLIVPANKKLYFIYNNSTGAVTVKVSGQTGVSVPATAKIILVSNGTDIVTANNYIPILISPSLTGTPIAPTASPGTNTTQIATTAFVTAATGTLGTMSTQNANNVAITGGTISGITSLGVSGTATATTFSGAGTSLTGTAAALSIGGNAATATNATNATSATSATSATTATTATDATNILGNSSQSYQNVTGSRSYGTTYTNSTGKPIFVYAQSGSSGYAMNLYGYVNGALAALSISDTFMRVQICFVVPIGSTYQITGNVANDYWLELR
jgi:hypothetical protein